MVFADILRGEGIMQIDQALVNASVKEYEDQHTPREGNLCSSDGCGGGVVEKVTGLFRGRFTYSLPHCEKCGRLYTLAINVKQVGREEFMKLLNEPFTL
jgi:hypothetical protein